MPGKATTDPYCRVNPAGYGPLTTLYSRQMKRLTALIHDHGKAIFTIDTFQVWSKFASTLMINFVSPSMRNWIGMIISRLTWNPLDSSSNPKERTTVLVGWNLVSKSVSMVELFPTLSDIELRWKLWDTYRMPIRPLLSSELPRPQIRFPERGRTMGIPSYRGDAGTHHQSSQNMVDESIDRRLLDPRERHLSWNGKGIDD